jgi:mRNA-degrading endonuclease toxin of MazEF toxin-antitoxin module
LKPGDVVVGAVEAKVRPAVVIASSTYLVERPDVLVVILTTKSPKPATSTDCLIQDWQSAGLRGELTVIGHLSNRDWTDPKERVRTAFAI